MEKICYHLGMKRSYRQNCSLALASDLLGERWTLLIIRELLIQPCRFKDLNSVLVGMGTNLLTNRLKELEAVELIERQSQSDKRSPYQLTEKGQQVETIVLAMIRWGNGNLTVTSEEQGEFSHHHHWDLLAMKALFNPDNYQANQQTELQFQTDDFSAWVRMDDKELSYGLGRHSAKAEDTIELPMTIAKLQQILASDGKEKKNLLMQNPKLAACLAAFN